ncbi:MAG: hypothetical protein AUJ92_09625 [Armatimonadetes bacterium CG2_30_59_28]|nr:MAG: hypothetical protein AUJ92_09625 [Armatimonadetes bacterium CG2_30_59_28]PIU67308.1 MAG: hypothetical protein COS85_01175 [Armatimonadetes bacterium CG07_land_8_20_14_0_80_59_28]PIX37981.1 MAG: hypothetical protein COZ56_21760 [Armatimonadetes bacterium CG_4_8_14_3_um_filter_58_9]PIY37240.1 MAG: hypothetical protein COZ05_22660 [Armatimonadetes bacterium CG_4_10_14_3_um_filter_59_10]
MLSKCERGPYLGDDENGPGDVCADAIVRPFTYALLGKGIALVERGPGGSLQGATAIFPWGGGGVATARATGSRTRATH